MGSSAVENTEEVLRKEIEELNRQQWEITQRLNNPRGLRRGGMCRPAGPRNSAANGARPRGLVRTAGDRTDAEDQRPAKKRLSSAVVKVEDGEIVGEAELAKDMKEKDSEVEGTVGTVAASQSDRKPFNSQRSGWLRRDGNQRTAKMDSEAQATEHVPRVLPQNDDLSLVSRNKRMLGLLVGTLEKFRKEDMKLSGTEAYMLRSTSLQKAEQRAREESERLRQQEREQIAEKWKRDRILKARVAAKAEEKKLELLFLRWSEHHKKLSNYIRTKTELPIYYLPTKPLDEDSTLAEQRKEQAFQEWKETRRAELSEYQKHIPEQYVAEAEKELERRQNARKQRNSNNDMLNLQETMDKELDTHRLEHGPKTRKIPGSGNNEDEDDIMDELLGGVEDSNSRRGEETAKAEAPATSPHADATDQ